jgi:hypothetical protein
MQNRFSFATGIGLLSACLLLVGCNDGPPAPKLTQVSGTVMLDGAPMAEGEITFSEPAKGAIDTIKVIDGRFEGKTQPGEKRVEIRAYRLGKPNTAMYGPDAKAEKENYIPAQYNSESTLTATIPEDGASGLTFEAKSK